MAGTERPTAREEAEDEVLKCALLGELECPVCMEFMIPPILVCKNGHNICEPCRAKITECPTCRRPYLGARNIALETITEGLLYPCVNRTLGCTNTYPAPLLADHLLVCEYFPFKCPLSVAASCAWEGPYGMIVQHVTECHKRYIKYEAESTYVLRDLKSTPGYTMIILALGEIFLHRSRLQNDKFYSAVQYVGPVEHSGGFKYEFGLRVQRGVESIRVCHVTSSHVEDLKAITNAGKCVRLDLEVMRRFMRESCLLYSLKISANGPASAGTLQTTDVQTP